MSLKQNFLPLTSKWTSTSQTVQGIFWMVLTTLLFVVVTGIIRHMGSNLPAAESAFIRYAFGFILMAPGFWRLYKKPPAQKHWGQFVLRGFAHSLGVILWFFAMARIPISEVTAIGYVTPICVTLGAALFLGERLKIRRIMGVVVGFIGAFIILRPGFQEVSIGQLAQLTAAPLFAASYLLTKSLTGKFDSHTIVTMLTLFCTIFLLPFALWDWQTPSLTDLMWLAATAVTATTGHYCMTKALNAAPVSVTQPITFLQLVWATTLGIVLFGEAIDPFVILGGGIIVIAATFISHREATQARKPITPPAAATKLH